MEFCAGWSTWRVQPWHGCGSEYLKGTADDLRWSCLIDHRPCLTKEFPPFLELFPNCLIKVFFNKDIEMS
jgi:hypothetical protein